MTDEVEMVFESHRLDFKVYIEVIRDLLRPIGLIRAVAKIEMYSSYVLRFQGLSREEESSAAVYAPTRPYTHLIDALQASLHSTPKLLHKVHIGRDRFRELFPEKERLFGWYDGRWKWKSAVPHVLY